MDELELAKLLGIACQATCGCGNGLIKYEGEVSNTNFFLTCRPYSDKYNHPMKIVIPKDCQLIKDHYENKHLKEDIENRKKVTNLLQHDNNELKELFEKFQRENINLQQKLKRISEILMIKYQDESRRRLDIELIIDEKSVEYEPDYPGCKIDSEKS